MRRVILESPYAGDIPRNTTYARRALRHALTCGDAPLASHLLYPQVLDEHNPAERTWGIEAGLVWGPQAQAAVFYVDYGLSPGMAKAMDRFALLGVPIETRTIGLNPP